MTFNTIFWLTIGTVSVGALLLLYKQGLVNLDKKMDARQAQLKLAALRKEFDNQKEGK